MRVGMVAVVGSGCGVLEYGESTGGGLSLGRVGIAGASGVMLAGEESSTAARFGRQDFFYEPRSGTGSQLSLFKIDDSGNITPVDYEDDTGDSISGGVTPTQIYQANSDYLLMTFQFDLTAPELSGYDSDESTLPKLYLVRKSDGAVFAFPARIQGIVGTGQSPIQTDRDGNIYFLGSVYNEPGNIYKVNVADPVNLSIQVYQPPGVTLDYWIQTQGLWSVSADGNLAYDSGPRIKKANGGIYNGSAEARAWVAPDGEFYYVDSSLGSVWPPSFKVQKLVFDSSYNATISDYGGALSENLGGCDQVVRGKLMGYGAGFGSMLGSGSVCYDPVANAPSTFSVSGVSRVSRSGASDQYYYFSGVDTSNQDILVRLDPDNFSTLPLLPTGDYSIYQFSVSPDDQVTFSALRYNDGKKVFGKIDASGSSPVVTILDESINAPAQSLIRIN